MPRVYTSSGRTNADRGIRALIGMRARRLPYGGRRLRLADTGMGGHPFLPPRVEPGTPPRQAGPTLTSLHRVAPTSRCLAVRAARRPRSHRELVARRPAARR